MKFSIITPTLQRDSLIHCCESLNSQTHTDWQHIIVVDGGDRLRTDLFDMIADSQSGGRFHRHILWLGKRFGDYGNTPRHLGWKFAQGDYVIHLDDDNHFAHNDALKDISTALSLSGEPDWAVFPILRFGQWFFSDNPRCCHVDSANLVIKREIAQWPNRSEYTLDGIFCEELKSKYPYVAFSEVAPIINVPVQGKGE